MQFQTKPLPSLYLWRSVYGARFIYLLWEWSTAVFLPLSPTVFVPLSQIVFVPLSKTVFACGPGPGSPKTAMQHWGHARALLWLEPWHVTLLSEHSASLTLHSALCTPHSANQTGVPEVLIVPRCRILTVMTDREVGPLTCRDMMWPRERQVRMGCWQRKRHVRIWWRSIWVC